MILEMSSIKNGFLGFKPESGKNDQRTEQRTQRKEGEVGSHQP